MATTRSNCPPPPEPTNTATSAATLSTNTKQTVSAARKRGYTLLVVGMCSLLSLGLTACSSSSSSDSSERPYLTAEEIMASHTSTETLKELRAAQDELAAQQNASKSAHFGLDTDHSSWTSENTAIYQQALHNTDLVYDEATASFINVESAPASQSIFTPKRSELFTPERTQVEYYDPEHQQARNTSTGREIRPNGSNSDDGSNANADDKESGPTRPARRTLNLMQVMALAHQAQASSAADTIAYQSRWERLRQGDPYPATEPHNPSSIKQNKTWWQLGDGPDRTRINYFDYDPFYYRPWYIRTGPAPLVPVHYRYHRGPAGGVFFHYVH